MTDEKRQLEVIQAIIDRSAEAAGPALARNFGGGGWRMDARQFVAFWSEARMAAIATASLDGRVHIAPVEFALVNGVFRIPTFADAVRLQDHRDNRRCAITSWDDAYHAVIVYGEARVVENGGMASVEVTPTRIHGIRPPGDVS